MSSPLVPVDGKVADWPRRVANAVNALIRRAETVDVGSVRYEAGALQWWDGSTWQAVP